MKKKINIGIAAALVLLTAFFIGVGFSGSDDKKHEKRAKKGRCICC